jgi:hypothetical protein
VLIKVTGIDVTKAESDRNRRIRNRMYGGRGGRRARALLLPDYLESSSFTVVTKFQIAQLFMSSTKVNNNASMLH